MSSLTDVGGWENLSCDWNDNYGLRACPNLTYQSCINILNGLYDFVGNGSATRKTVYISSICGLSYKECGTYSGWKYKVNGDVPPVGCSMYKLKDGDTISWYYSINVTD